MKPAFLDSITTFLVGTRRHERVQRISAFHQNRSPIGVLNPDLAQGVEVLLDQMVQWGSA
jgi:hypothetical protein